MNPKLYNSERPLGHQLQLVMRNLRRRIGPSNLAAGAVETDALADGSVTPEKTSFEDLLTFLSEIEASPDDAISRSLSLAASSEEVISSQRTITIQVVDYAASAMSGRYLIDIWTATADYGAPSASLTTIALVTGTQVHEFLANGRYQYLTDSTGKIAFTVAVVGAATRYVLAENAGKVYSSGALSWT